MGSHRVDDRLITRRWYDRIAPYYGGISGGFEVPSRRAGLRQLAVEPGEVVIDIGCGQGDALTEIAHQVEAEGLAIGLDISPCMCHIARRHIRVAGLTDRCLILEADGTTLPLADASIDAVFMSFTLELLPIWLIDRLLDEVARILVDDGRLTIVSLVDRPVTCMQTLYWVLHWCAPRVVDCRPIPLERYLTDCGFQIERAERELMAGIPVGIVTARPQAIGRMESNG